MELRYVVWGIHRRHLFSGIWRRTRLAVTCGFLRSFTDAAHHILPSTALTSTATLGFPGIHLHQMLPPTACKEIVMDPINCIASCLLPETAALQPFCTEPSSAFILVTMTQTQVMSLRDKRFGPWRPVTADYLSRYPSGNYDALDQVQGTTEGTVAEDGATPTARGLNVWPKRQCENKMTRYYTLRKCHP